MRYDFALLFTVLTALTGAIWLIDALFFAPARKRAFAAEMANAEPPPAGEDDSSATTGENNPREPVLVEYSRSLFPVILIILLVRSFLGEPYRIPSKSMMPTLVIGDFILVNKYAYGLRLPVLDTKIVKVGEPQRGDVIVFHPPLAPNEVWIKRVIGLPGDTVAYDNYQLTINGKPVPTQPSAPYVGRASGRVETGEQQFSESMPGHDHLVLSKNIPPMFQEGNGTWTVPPDTYFMMGDNRDDSADSRFWPKYGYTSFLPERDIVGKAVLVWMNYDFDAWEMDSSRIGTIIR